MRNQLGRSTPVTGASTNCYTVKHRSSLFLVLSLRSFTYGHKKMPRNCGATFDLAEGEGLPLSLPRGTFIQICGEGGITSAPWTADSGDPGRGASTFEPLRSRFIGNQRLH